MNCLYCKSPVAWLVEDILSGYARAACQEHVALALPSRLAMVVRYEEDGPSMRDLKKQIEEQQLNEN